MKRFPSHHSIYIVGRSNLSHFLRNSTGPVSPSEQPDRPGFRVNFSRWGPGGLDLKPHPIRAVLKLPKTRPIRVSSGFDYLKTDQMFGPMPLLPLDLPTRNCQSSSPSTIDNGLASSETPSPNVIGTTI